MTELFLGCTGLFAIPFGVFLNKMPWTNHDAYGEAFITYGALALFIGLFVTMSKDIRQR